MRWTMTHARHSEWNIAACVWQVQSIVLKLIQITFASAFRHGTIIIKRLPYFNIISYRQCDNTVDDTHILTKRRHDKSSQRKYQNGEPYNGEMRLTSDCEFRFASGASFLSKLSRSCCYTCSIKNMWLDIHACDAINHISNSVILRMRASTTKRIAV